MNMTRREFVAGMSAAAAVSACGAASRKEDFIWCMYQQLGSHMWPSAVKAPCAENGHYCGESTPIDDASWERRMASCAKNGCNMMVVDIAEGMHFSTHPELALKGTRSQAWMNERVRRLRDMGITAIPSLNFSTAHDFWLGRYSRMISTPEYYRCCADLIGESFDVFERPPLFFLGMDEENPDNTSKCHLSVRRQGELLWHDIDFYAKTVQRLGARPWMAADYEWWEPTEYCKHVSKDILQTNWYYGYDFDFEKLTGVTRTYVKGYLDLDKAGFDQVPACSNYVGVAHKKAGRTVNVENIPGTVAFARRVIDPKRLKGVMCMPWVSTTSATDPKWIDACDQFGAALARDGAK